MKTIKRSKLNLVTMSVKMKPDKVVDGDKVYHYVGIGWIDVTDHTTEEEKKKLPKVIN